MTALETILKLFPRTADQKNLSVTGLIDIELFNKMEASIRPAMREAGLRAMYRGPRNYRYQTMTHRSDAVGVLMYPKR